MTNETSENPALHAVRTSDLALAAYLTMQGCKHTRLEMDTDGDRPGQAVWVYDTTEKLQDQIELFKRSEARVEPFAYLRIMTEVRGELYKFLEDGGY